jgi:hypothetical protein
MMPGKRKTVKYVLLSIAGLLLHMSNLPGRRPLLRLLIVHNLMVSQLGSIFPRQHWLATLC